MTPDCDLRRARVLGVIRIPGSRPKVRTHETRFCASPTSIMYLPNATPRRCAGKGIGAAIPNLLACPGSASYSTSGENFAVTIRARRQAGQTSA